MPWVAMAPASPLSEPPCEPRRSPSTLHSTIHSPCASHHHRCRLRALRDSGTLGRRCRVRRPPVTWPPVTAVQHVVPGSTTHTCQPMDIANRWPTICPSPHAERVSALPAIHHSQRVIVRLYSPRHPVLTNASRVGRPPQHRWLPHH